MISAWLLIPAFFIGGIFGLFLAALIAARRDDDG